MEKKPYHHCHLFQLTALHAFRAFFVRERCSGMAWITWISFLGESSTKDKIKQLKTWNLCFLQTWYTPPHTWKVTCNYFVISWCWRLMGNKGWTPHFALKKDVAISSLPWINSTWHWTQSYTWTTLCSCYVNSIFGPAWWETKLRWMSFSELELVAGGNIWSFI